MSQLKMITTFVIMLLVLMPMIKTIVYSETVYPPAVKTTLELCEGKYFNGAWNGTDCIGIPDPQRQLEWEHLRQLEAEELERTREEWRQACAQPGSCTFIELW